MRPVLPLSQNLKRRHQKQQQKSIANMLYKHRCKTLNKTLSNQIQHYIERIIYRGCQGCPKMFTHFKITSHNKCTHFFGTPFSGIPGIMTKLDLSEECKYLVQHPKTNQYNSPQKKREKTYDHFHRCEKKNIWQNLTS